jgi:hypothetical protein
MRKGLASILLLVSCGSGNKASPDAAIDAPKSIDAAIDGPPIMGTGNFHHYVLNTVTAPASSSQFAIVHVDASGNPVATGGTAVNKLGGLLSTLKSAGGFDVQTSLTQAVNDGSINLLGDLQTPDFTTASAAAFQILLGTNPNPPACAGSADHTCGHQFGGSAMFDLGSNTGNVPLGGMIATGQLDAGPGSISIELSLGVSPVIINLKDALVQASALSAAGIGSATLGGAILETDIHSVLFPAIAAELNATVAADCTAAVGSACSGSGETLVTCSGATPPKDLCCTGGAGKFIGDMSVVGIDANKDCVITAQDLSSNFIISALLSPDVSSTGNGTKDAVSFGAGATAVGAVFTVPGE